MHCLLWCDVAPWMVLPPQEGLMGNNYLYGFEGLRLSNKPPALAQLYTFLKLRNKGGDKLLEGAQIKLSGMLWMLQL